MKSIIALFLLVGLHLGAQTPPNTQTDSLNRKRNPNQTIDTARYPNRTVPNNNSDYNNSNQRGNKIKRDTARVKPH